MTNASPNGERALIDRIRETAVPSRFVRVGIGDDCAVLRPPPGAEIVVTTDFALEGRHFHRDWHSAESAGHRCLARGLSDIAAMGAQPMAAFLSLALPAGYRQRWVDGFLAGLHRLAARHGVALAGGDTAESPGPHILADIVLVGAAPRGRALRRSGARAGDRLYVTGSLGGSAAELQRMQAGHPRRLPRQGTADRHPQMFPEPRVQAGRALLRRACATACIDTSDGLSTDLAHICRESGVGAEVFAAALPLGPGATLAQALHGGEDYELLFAARPGANVLRPLAGVAVTAIGRLVRGTGVTLVAADGTATPLEPGGWEHLRPA